MLEKQWAAPEEFDQMHAEITREIEAAIEWAENSPYPDPATLLDGVYEP
jgi:TPP-dependent pyruvate/acetoin dehydrogenase alpha subunit